MKVQYPDTGEFELLVSPVSLDDYERVSVAVSAAVAHFRPETLRALADVLTLVAKPTRDGEAVAFGDQDPNVIVALGLQWLKGVRDVPLPLPVRPSDITPSEATPAP